MSDIVNAAFNLLIVPAFFCAHARTKNRFLHGTSFNRGGGVSLKYRMPANLFVTLKLVDDA